jgi:rhomboid family GlyGly-CTERM serine protease
MDWTPCARREGSGVRRTLLVAAAVAVAATPGLFPHLVLDRGAVLDGEIWRLFSGHLVHGSASHLLWDVLPLLAIGMLFERALGTRWWLVLGASALTVSVGLLAMEPDLSRYCGLSGVLNALWVAGALQGARNEEASGSRAMAWIYRACVLCGLAKVALEAFTGTQIFTEAVALGVIPIPLAHALGALAGPLLLPGRKRAGGESSPGRQHFQPAA